LARRAQKSVKFAEKLAWQGLAEKARRARLLINFVLQRTLAKWLDL
jgi:hypothetical protein